VSQKNKTKILINSHLIGNNGTVSKFKVKFLPDICQASRLSSLQGFIPKQHSTGLFLEFTNYLSIGFLNVNSGKTLDWNFL
jgi:hypothetical protein